MKRVFTHIGFSCAVTLIALNYIGVDYAAIITSGLAILFLASLAFKNYRQAITLPLCLGASLFACLLFLCVYGAAVEPSLALSGKNAEFSFYIIDLPSYDDGKYSYIVKVNRIFQNGAPQNIKLKVVTSSPIIADTYQLINAKGYFTALGNNAFSSYGYWSDSIFLTARVKDFIITDNYVFSPLAPLLSLRNDIIETLLKTVGNTEGAVAAALVTGDRYYIENDIKTAFMLSGASHLLAVSGLHLSVITVSVNKLFKALSINKKLSDFVTLVFVLVFMALTGFSGSVVRAGIMVITMLLARLLSRKADTLNSLGMATFIICLNPFAVSDAGAALSVLSVLGIITVYPYLIKLNAKPFSKLNSKRKRYLIPVNKLINYAFKSVLISISVILVTLPAMYIFFGYVSFAGLISNIVAVPLGSLSTVACVICYLFSKIGFLSNFSVFVCSNIIALLLALIRAFASFRFLTIPFSYYFAFIIAGMLVLTAINFIAFKNRAAKATLYLCVVILCFSLAINAFSQYNNADMLVTENGAVAVAYDNKLLVYGVKTKSDYYSVKGFAVSRGNEITLLIDSEESEYAYNLFNELGAKRVISSSRKYSFNNKRLNVKDYNASLAKGYMVRYSRDEYVLINVCSRSVVIGSKNAECDFYVDKQNVYDSKGIIDLDNGEVVYSLNKTGFTAWR